MSANNVAEEVAMLESLEANRKLNHTKRYLRVCADACELVGAVVPFHQVLHAVRLEDVVNNVIQSVRADQAFGRTRVYEDAIDLLVLHEVERVELMVALFRMVDECCRF